MAAHDPTPLEVLGRFTRTGGREFVRPCNPDRGRAVCCVGLDAVRVGPKS